MGNILSEYYHGIVGQIQAEVEYINALFEHQGLKGSGNELKLVNMLKKFIPKKYGIGTGVIIDREGNQSRQCDIIIYDNQNYPDVLSISSSKFYPIEIVYAVIEVKTRLNLSSARESIQNIESVKSLKQSNQRFRVYPTDPVEKIDDNTSFWETQSPTPPLGFVFAYKSKTNKLRTFHNWYNSELNRNFPDFVCCLDQGILLLKSEKMRDLPMAFPINDGVQFHEVGSKEIVNSRGEKMCLYKNSLTPYTQIGKTKCAIDVTSTFLEFVHILIEALKKKNINPDFNLFRLYMAKHNKIRFLDQNGELVVWDGNTGFG